VAARQPACARAAGENSNPAGPVESLLGASNCRQRPSSSPLGTDYSTAIYTNIIALLVIMRTYW
jgi:hypothetical protein